MHDYRLKWIVAIVVVYIIFGAFIVNVTKHSYIISVVGKESKTYSDKSKYLIYCELDSGRIRVFENTDSLLVFKFNSSDIYGAMAVGSKYRVSTVGVRVPLFSMYENIVSMESIN